MNNNMKQIIAPLCFAVILAACSEGECSKTGIYFWPKNGLP